jgi:hypothetical protein
VKINSKNRIKGQLPACLKKALAYSIVLAVPFLLFLFGGVNESGAKNQQPVSDATCFTSNQTDKRPFDLPFSPLSSSEMPDENDLEEELDSDEDDTEYWNRAIEANVSQDRVETPHLNYHRQFHNHASVSLVILYHSWKSNLS